MKIKIVETEFNPFEEVEAYQQTQSKLAGAIGATNIFIGTMRDFNEGDNIVSMYLEHYPKMTEKQLEKIVQEAMQQWAILDVLVVHRVGELLPNQAIVLVVVWTSHRGDAFDASRYIMEALKSKAPFWKKEQLATKTRWVEKNTDGYQLTRH